MVRNNYADFFCGVDLAWAYMRAIAYLWRIRRVASDGELALHARLRLHSHDESRNSHLVLVRCSRCALVSSPLLARRAAHGSRLRFALELNTMCSANI